MEGLQPTCGTWGLAVGQCKGTSRPPLGSDSGSMGASSSLQDLPQELDETQARELWTRSGRVPDEWPSARWAEISTTDGRVNRERLGQLVAVLDEEEEVFAEDGALEQSLDPELAQGSYDVEPEEDLELSIEHPGGLGLSVVGTGAAPGGLEGPAPTSSQEVEDEGEILAADGEAFADGVGPGTYDEAELEADGGKLADDGAGLGLLVEGHASPGKPSPSADPPAA